MSFKWVSSLTRITRMNTNFKLAKLATISVKVPMEALASWWLKSLWWPSCNHITPKQSYTNLNKGLAPLGVGLSFIPSIFLSKLFKGLLETIFFIFPGRASSPVAMAPVMAHLFTSIHALSRLFYTPGEGPPRLCAFKPPAIPCR
jgi:hypothetical protein